MTTFYFFNLIKTNKGIKYSIYSKAKERQIKCQIGSLMFSTFSRCLYFVYSGYLYEIFVVFLSMYVKNMGKNRIITPRADLEVKAFGCSVRMPAIDHFLL